MRQHGFAWLIGALLSVAIFASLAGCKGGPSIAPSAPGGGNSVFSPSAKGKIKTLFPPQVVDDSGNVGGQTSIAIDQNTGRVRFRISYYDQRDKSLRLASSSAVPPVFTLSPADTDPVGVGRFNFVLADTTSDPADVVYYYRDYGGVKRARIFQNKPVPDLAVVDPTHDFGAGLQAISRQRALLGRLEVAALVYVGSTTSNPLARRVKVELYVEEFGAPPEIDTIDDAPANAGSFGFPSLAADPTSDNLGVAYKGQTGQLRFATGTEGGLWTIQDVKPGDPLTARVGQTSTLFGADGSAHILFNACLPAGCQVYHASQSPGASWQIEPLIPFPPGHPLAFPFSIQTPGAAAMDSGGNIHVVAYRSDTHSPIVFSEVVVRGVNSKQKHWVASNFRFIWDSQSDLGQGAALAIGDLDGDGIPDLAISFVDNTHHDLMFAYQPADSTGSLAPVINSRTSVIVVADAGNNRLQMASILDPPPYSWTQVPGPADGFNNPRGVQCACAGGSSLFVADTGNNRILFAPDGMAPVWQVISTGGSAVNQVSAPQELAFNPSSDTLYIADSGNNRILEVDNACSPGRSFSVFAGATGGSAIGQVSGPRGVAVDTLGDVYVADTLNNRIQVNTTGDAKGWQIFAGATAGSVPGKVSGPRGIFVDEFLRVYVADTGNNRIQVNIYGTALGWRALVGGGPPGSAGVSAPEGVVTDLDGDLFVGDTGNNQVERYLLRSGVPTVVGPPGSGPGQFSSPGNVS